MEQIKNIMEQILAEKSYYADADGKLVDGSDPKAATLVAAQGTILTPTVIKQYGIKQGPAKAEKATEKAEDADTKAAKKVIDSKAVRPASNK